MRLPIFDASNVLLDVPEALRPSAMRRLGITPDQDVAIDALPVPQRPFWRHWAIRFLRTYRRIRPVSIGNRCVFEPSCSRYGELAFRTRSFPEAVRLTAGRLHRCRPGQGGLDLQGLETPG